MDLTEAERNNSIGCHGPRTNVRIVVADFRACLESCARIFQAELYIARFVRGATHKKRLTPVPIPAMAKTCLTKR